MLRAPARQHVVSQVVSKRWTVNGGFVAMSIEDGRSWRSAPSHFGWIRDFISAAAKDAERRWQEVEAAASVALQAITDRTLFDDESLVRTVKDLLALHFARSGIAREVWARAHNRTIAASRDINDYEPGALEQVFLELTGRAATSDADLSVAAEAIADGISEQLATGEPFREQVYRLEEQAGARITAAALHVGVVAAGGELIIGDTPALPADTETDRVGVLKGVGIEVADTFMMPVDPFALVSLASFPGARDDWIELDGRAVQRLNILQVRGAQRQIVGRSEEVLREARLLAAATEG